MPRTIMLQEPRGTGIASLVRRMIADDLAGLTQELPRQAIELALDETGAPIGISPRGGTLLIAGMSGGGKSTVATGLLERFLDDGFQFCVIDPASSRIQCRWVMPSMSRVLRKQSSCSDT